MMECKCDCLLNIDGKCTRQNKEDMTAQALSDFTENIIDYWKSSDDAPQQSILDALVDLGVELGNRKKVAEENVRQAKERGYEQYYNWKYKGKDIPFSRVINLYTKAESEK